MRSMTFFLVWMAAASLAADSVWTEPARPTDRDSITFHLFLEDNCCCTQYYNKGFLVQDTALYLLHDFDSDSCMVCLCFMPGSWTEFVSGPVKAGTYVVYSWGQIYCPPGRICPLGMMAPMRVGELTVTGSSQVTRGIVPSARRAVTPGMVYTLDGRPAQGGITRGVAVDGSGMVRIVPVR